MINNEEIAETVELINNMRSSDKKNRSGRRYRINENFDKKL